MLKIIIKSKISVVKETIMKKKLIYLIPLSIAIIFVATALWYQSTEDKAVKRAIASCETNDCDTEETEYLDPDFYEYPHFVGSVDSIKKKEKEFHLRYPKGTFFCKYFISNKIDRFVPMKEIKEYLFQKSKCIPQSVVKFQAGLFAAQDGKTPAELICCDKKKGDYDHIRYERLSLERERETKPKIKKICKKLILNNESSGFYFFQSKLTSFVNDKCSPRKQPTLKLISQEQSSEVYESCCQEDVIE